MSYQTMLRIVAIGFATVLTGCAATLNVPDEVACPGSRVAVETQALLIRSELTMAPAPSVASEGSQLGLVRWGKTERQITVQEDTTFTLTPVSGPVKTDSVSVLAESQTRDFAFEPGRCLTDNRIPGTSLRFIRYSGVRSLPWSDDLVIQQVTNNSDRFVTLVHPDGTRALIEGGATADDFNGLPANAGWNIFLEERRRNEGCGDPSPNPLESDPPVIDTRITDPPTLMISMQYGCSAN